MIRHRLTPAQRTALEQISADGGVVELSRLDGRPISRRVIDALHEKGLVRNEAPATLTAGETWSITRAGLDHLQPAGAPVGKREPMPVHCGVCRHEWNAAYLPMEAGRFTRILKTTHCPNCGVSMKKIFMGPIKAPSPRPRETG